MIIPMRSAESHLMFKIHARRWCAIVLFCAAGFGAIASVRADERAERDAAAIDTPEALKNGELVFHGNYCGVGNRAGAAPTDALDVACMHHDACTPTGKIQICACNARLAEEAGAVARDPLQTAELRSLALLTATAATAGMALCIPSTLTVKNTVGVAPPPPAPAAAIEPAAEASAPVNLSPPLPLVTPPAIVPTAPDRDLDIEK
jgi:hypothetical protein